MAQGSGALHVAQGPIQQHEGDKAGEENATSQRTSYGYPMDLLDQDLPIAEVVQRYGPEFDMAIENVLDDLSIVRTYLDDMMISTIGSHPPVSQGVDRQLQRASCVCHTTMRSVQRTLEPFIQELQTLLRTETLKGDPNSIPDE